MPPVLGAGVVLAGGLFSSTEIRLILNGVGSAIVFSVSVLRIGIRHKIQIETW